MHTITKPSCNKFQEQRCPACGKVFRRNLIGREKRFCTEDCRLETHRTNRKAVQRLKNGARYPHEGLQRNDARSACDTGTFLVENPGRASHGIVGPRTVLEIECGGTWDEPFAREIRPPALVKDGVP